MATSQQVTNDYFLSDKRSRDVRFMRDYPATSFTLATLVALCCTGAGVAIFYNFVQYQDLVVSEGDEYVWTPDPGTGLLPSANYLGVSDPIIAIFFFAMAVSAAYHAWMQYQRLKPTETSDDNTIKDENNNNEGIHGAVGGNFGFMLSLELAALYGLAVGLLSFMGGNEYDAPTGFLPDSSDVMQGTYLSLYALLFVLAGVGLYKQACMLSAPGEKEPTSSNDDGNSANKEKAGYWGVFN